MSPATKARTPASARRTARTNGDAAPATPAGNGHASIADPTKAAIPAYGPDAAQWREFVGRWLASAGGTITDAARGDWEVALPDGLQKRWRRQRVRLVFDPLRATLPRGAWFTAPGSTAGQKMLEAAREEPLVTHRTALAQVPGAPPEGLASVCRVRGLTWGEPRLGPVTYERRVTFHAVVTLWGGLPSQESWVVLLGPDGALLESVRAAELAEIRARDGLYQIHDPLAHEAYETFAASARGHFETLLDEREREWEASVGKLRDEELRRLGGFFAARVEEEEERSRRRVAGADVHDLEGGDTTTLKLEWERRAAEVCQRWALRTEVRWWGVTEWAWPVAELEQELKAGAMRVRLVSRVDVARGRPALPSCPHCHTPAEMLVRARGSIACPACAPA